MFSPFLLFLAALAKGQLEGMPTFIDDPSSFKTIYHGIYIPPEGDLSVVCSTQNPADIIWKSDVDVKITPNFSRKAEYGPGNADLNVTQVTDRKSVLYVRSNDNAAKGILMYDGPFICQARDRTTSQKSTTLPFTFDRGYKPEITSQSNSIQTPVGQSIRIYCAMPYFVEPSVSVTWTFQKAHIQSELNFTKIVFGEQRFILEVTGEKASNGTYQCRISNRFGVALSTPIDVIVTYLANMTISIDPPSLQVIENNDVRVSAHVVSNPAPYNITLLSKNGILKISVSNRRTLDYTFKAEKGDTGSFKMRSAHVSGHVNEAFYLTVLSPPSEVTFYIMNVAHNSVAFNWSVGMNGNTNVTRVKLCCGDTGEDLNVANKGLCAFPADFQQTDKLSSSETLFGLMPNKTYYCKIYAANKVGVTASRFQIVKTKPTVPSEPNVTSCISEEETSITLTWTLSNGGSEIKQYFVQYRSFGKTWLNQSLTQTRGSTRLSKLTKETKYDIEIAAVNSVGRSPVGGGQCSTTCDLSAPLELSDTRTVLEDGLALQLYVDDRCGDVVGFASQLCSGQHVQTTFSSITSQTFWVNITGIENDQHCIMTKATTDKQISSLYATFEVTRLKDSGSETTILVIYVLVAVFPTCLIIVVFIVFCRRRRRDREPKETSNHKDITLPVNANEMPMQDSRAYGVLPLKGSGRMYRKDSPL